MIDSLSSWSRCAFVPWLTAVGLLLSACESPQSRARTQAESAKPLAVTVPLQRPRPLPPATVPPATVPPAPAPFPLPEPTDAEAHTPSLIPFLTRTPGQGAPPAVVQPPAPPPMTPSAVRVALLLPLSGRNARLGNAMVNAAQLALFDLADDRFELLIHDTRGTTEGAADAATLAIGDGASLILGPLLSASVTAVAPAARAANVRVVAFSSDRSVAGRGIFTMGFFPGAGVKRVVTFARSRGILRFAVLAPESEYGTTVVEALRRAAEEVGAVVTRVETYDPGEGDFAAVVRRLAQYGARRQALMAQRAALEAQGGEIARRTLRRLEKLQTVGDLPFDALMVADGGKRLQSIAAHLPFYDVDPAKVRMLGTGQWDEPGIGAEPALVGGWFAAPPPDARADFVRQFLQVYGHKPPRLATLAYDATALAAVLARTDGGPDFSAQALTAPSGFAGRDGIFRFLPDGMAERGLAVLKVLPRGFEVIGKAPETFQPVTE